MVGGGHDFSEMILGGQIALAAIPLWFALRFALTVASYSTGAPGGVFAPMLVLGALLGLGVGEGVSLLYPGLVATPTAFAVVGMAAFFASVVRAPLTGIVLIVEMTGSYALMLPLLLACFCAYVMAEALRTEPLYEWLLERDLARRGITPPAATLVVEYEVRQGSRFAGLQVRNLGLPRGCVIVRIRDGVREVIPQAETTLLPHQRVTVVIAPEAVGAHELLRAGLGHPVPAIDTPPG
jgi:CIC family chloride channel protein